jgi:hypothetical protein
MEARKAIVAIVLFAGFVVSPARTVLGTDPAPAVARSTNFVVTAPTHDLASEVLDNAESLRDEIAQTWLGSKLPPSVGPALIHVRLSQTEDKGLAWVADHPSRLTHIVWLTTTRESALGSALAHEMTHVVLATRYPGQIPAWVNEGIAGMQDDRERHQIRRQILEWFAQTQNWPDVRSVLEANLIGRNDQAKYAVAVSLAEMLIDADRKPEFLEFAVAGKRDGWDSALERYYDLPGVTALQSAWQAWLAKRSVRLASTRSP